MRVIHHIVAMDRCDRANAGSLDCNSSDYVCCEKMGVYDVDVFRTYAANEALA